jgi:alpha-tubulin suppressor-like RCC1 family protein
LSSVDPREFVLTPLVDMDKSDNSDTYGDENLNFANFRSYIQRTPKLVNGLEHVRVVQAAAGYGYSVVVTDMGKVYSWGFNDKLVRAIIKIIHFKYARMLLGS